jgi:predicted transposase/invertase (TIGR01784 family)
MSLPNAHDAVFKQFLSDPDTARDFLAIHLPETLRNLCDLSTLRLEPGTFLDKDLRAHYSDILYSVGTTTDNTGYIYAVVEHQSTPDKLMAFRLMRYTLSVMNNHLRKGHDRLPLVIPMLFYHGTTSPYPFSTNWIDLFDLPAIAWKLYSQPFPLVDVTVLDDNNIMQHKRIAVLELVQRDIRRRDLLEFVGKIVLALQSNPCTPEQMESLLTYMAVNGETTDPKQFIDMLTKGLPEYEDVNMATIAQYLEEKGRQEGRQEGMASGMEKGRQEEKRQVASKMLMKGIDPVLVIQVTGLTAQELEQLKH